MSSLLDHVVAGNRMSAALEPSVLARIVREHRARVYDHSELLWGVLNLGLWREAYHC